MADIVQIPELQKKYADLIFRGRASEVVSLYQETGAVPSASNIAFMLGQERRHHQLDVIRARQHHRDRGGDPRSFVEPPVDPTMRRLYELFSGEAGVDPKTVDLRTYFF